MILFSYPIKILESIRKGYFKFIMNVIKNQRFICINENDKPVINEDGSFQIVEIYRGFETQEDFETTIERKSLNWNKKTTRNKRKIL